MRAFIYTLIGLILLIPALASAQMFQGGVRGAVRGADGGVLPGHCGKGSADGSVQGAIRVWKP